MKFLKKNIGLVVFSVMGACIGGVVGMLTDLTADDIKFVGKEAGYNRAAIIDLTERIDRLERGETVIDEE